LQYLALVVSKIILLSFEVLAKVSNGHPPQPLPSPALLRKAGQAREGLIYQPSPLVGGGKGEGVNGLLQEPLMIVIYLD
jgi:hypothetical protein